MRCGAPYVCLLSIIILVVVVLVVLLVLELTGAALLITPYRRTIAIPPDKGKRRANERLHVPLLLAANCTSLSLLPLRARLVRCYPSPHNSPQCSV